MNSKLSFGIFLLFSIIPKISLSQEEQPAIINISDKAPALKIKTWLKGTPVNSFEKGKVYVMDFWATWCGPCKEAMPHFSKLAKKYKDKITFIGVDILENAGKMRKNTEQLKYFVDSMGKQMNFNVAVQDSNFMESDWMNASGTQAIPSTFIINEEGRIAWIGHPSHLDTILPKILNKEWDIKKAFTLRINLRSEEQLVKAISNSLYQYDDNRNIQRLHPDAPYDFGKPDSLLISIDKIVQQHPDLKYEFQIASRTFSALLKTDMHKAYTYGKIAVQEPSHEEYGEPGDGGAIFWNVRKYYDKLKLTKEIYELGGEALQKRIHLFYYYSAFSNHTKRYYHLISLDYHQMAAWYWLAKDKHQAKKAGRKSIRTYKKSFRTTKEELNKLKQNIKLFKKDYRQKTMNAKYGILPDF